MYFFVMHETFVRTVFELLAKKHLPFFSCFTKKKILLMSLLTKINLLCENISAEGISCAIVCSFIIEPTFLKEQLFFVSPHLFSDAKMMYDVMLCDMI
jgi:hypothetical protein